MDRNDRKRPLFAQQNKIWHVKRQFHNKPIFDIINQIKLLKKKLNFFLSN
jgi:hypothetical protein